MSIYLLRVPPHYYVSVRSRRKHGNPIEYMTVLNHPGTFGEKPRFQRVDGDLHDGQVAFTQREIDADRPVALLYNDLQAATDAFAHLAKSAEAAVLAEITKAH